MNRGDRRKIVLCCLLEIQGKSICSALLFGGIGESLKRAPSCVDRRSRAVHRGVHQSGSADADRDSVEGGQPPLHNDRPRESQGREEQEDKCQVILSHAYPPHF